MKTKTIHCSQCAVLVINGVICHEHGCPDTWKDETRNCEWCGSEYKPTCRTNVTCSEDCEECYSE